MIITYKFDNGEKTEIEVDDKIGDFILESRRREDNLSRKERYHCVSSDAFDFEGEAFGMCDAYSFDDESRIPEMINTFRALTDTQKRRLKMYMSGMSVSEIAREEGTAFNAVWKSIQAAQKQFKKYL